MEVVQESEGIARFKASRHHMWIQATRDPKKKWLEMQYCITREEVDWIIKDWPAQWKVPVEKPTTNPTTMTSSKPKGKAEAGPSTKTNIPAANTRKVVAHTQASGSNTVPKRPRRTTTVPREDIQGDAKNGETSQAEKRGHK
jgi:hypothetical protein